MALNEPLFRKEGKRVGEPTHKIEKTVAPYRPVTSEIFDETKIRPF